MSFQGVWGEYYQVPGLPPFRYTPLHKGQQEIWDSKARFLGYISGKGSGKSSFCGPWLQNEIDKNPKGKFIICGPSYKILEQGVLPEFFKHFHNENNAYYQKDGWKENKKVYKLKSGGTIYVRSLDDPEAVNGIHANAIVVDELGQLSHNVWDILESRVAKNLGRILATTTPYRGVKWLQTEFIERAKHDPNYFAVQFPSNINPGFSTEEYERQRAKMPAWKFAQDYDGLFVSPEGLVFPELVDCVVPMPEAGLPAGRLVGAIDPGFNDRNPFVALAGVLAEDNCLWLCYEHYVFSDKQKFWSLEDHAKYLPEDVTWYVDSQRPDVANSLKRLGHYAKLVKKTAGSIDAGIDLVTARIRTGKLKIIKGEVTKLLEECDEYRHATKDEEILESKYRGPDHCADCARYICMALDTKPQMVGV